VEPPPSTTNVVDGHNAASAGDSPQIQVETSPATANVDGDGHNATPADSAIQCQGEPKPSTSAHEDCHVGTPGSAVQSQVEPIPSTSTGGIAFKSSKVTITQAKNESIQKFCTSMIDELYAKNKCKKADKYESYNALFSEIFSNCKKQSVHM
jgi:hypothetical protein